MDLVRRRNETLGPRDMVEDFFDRMFEGWGLTSSGTLTPALDLAETGDAVVVRAELPGVKAEELDLSVQGNTLFISGQKKEESKKEQENYYHVERRYGSFRREITLPSAVDPEKIEATCRDGVLTIRMPKSEAYKPRKIKVEAK